MRANKINLRAVAVAAGLAAVFATGSAYAADVVYNEPPAPAAPMETPPVATWAGPYAGATVGYGFGGTTSGAAGGSIATNGWLFGGFAGYNWQSGNFVYGLEGDLGYNGMNSGNGTTYARQGLEGSLRARFGYAASDNVLLYATAGGAGSQVRIYDAAGNATGSAFGWTVGAGADVKMTNNVFGRLEYRYNDYGSADLLGLDGDFDQHVVMIGVGYKF